jgi:hypothetical protein
MLALLHTLPTPCCQRAQGLGVEAGGARQLLAAVPSLAHRDPRTLDGKVQLLQELGLAPQQAVALLAAQPTVLALSKELLQLKVRAARWRRAQPAGDDA